MEATSEGHCLDSLDKLKQMYKMFREYEDTTRLYHCKHFLFHNIKDSIFIGAKLITKGEGVSITSGEANLALTGSTLYELNEVFDNLQNGLNPPHLSSVMQGHRHAQNQALEVDDWNHYVQLLLDIMSRAPVLTLYAGGTHDVFAYRRSLEPIPMSRPVHLAYFANLRQLYVSYIPINLIQDLLKLRPRLTTLSATNCIGHDSHLQNVLELCEDDVSVPMQWTALKTLVLRCNGLRELDGSLRLCPILSALDLSRNRLACTDVYLGYLIELVKVDLRFNRLITMPSFAATAKKKLHTLLLGGNNLTDLTGIEEMTALVELDLSENHISSHQKLMPLKHLHRLERLNLRGCPISMRQQHRVTSLQHISSLALSREFTLDGSQVTAGEVKKSRMAKDRSNTCYQPVNSANNFIVQSRAVDHIGDVPFLISGSHTSTETGEENVVGVQAVKTGKKKRSRKAKPRTMEITDMDVSTTECSSKEVTPSSSPQPTSRLEASVQARKKEVQRTRKQMEELRLYYGDDWLQAISDQDKLPCSAVLAPPLAASSLQPSLPPSAASKAQMLVEENHRRGLVSTPKKVRGPEALNDTDEFSRGDQLMKNSFDNSSLATEVVVHNEKVFAQADAEVKVFDRRTMLPSSESSADDTEVEGFQQRPQRAQPTDDDLYMTETFRGTKDNKNAKDNKLSEAAGLTERKAIEEDELDGLRSTKDIKAETVELDSSSSGHDNTAEPENQSEPFIVSLPDKNNDTLLITVSPRYLIEKNINGNIQETLDLQCLETMKITTEENEEESKSSIYNEDGGQGSLTPEIIRVHLMFSYVRKDRRSRTYIMEDETNAEEFTKLLQPFIEAKAQAALQKLSTEYQCLKCQEIFTEKEAYTVLHLDSIPRTGSSKDFQNLADLSGKRIIQCPSCKSDHVIQLETKGSLPETNSSPTSSGSIPFSGTIPYHSSNRKQSLDQLMTTYSSSPRSGLQKQTTSSSDSHFGKFMAASEGTGRSARLVSPPREFAVGSRNQQMIGDGPSCVQQITTHQKGEDIISAGRKRSNAFYLTPEPLQQRQRSNAFIMEEEKSRHFSLTSPNESNFRRNSNPSFYQSVGELETDPTTKSLSHLPTVHSSHCSDCTHTRPSLSSVDSDILVFPRTVDSSSSSGAITLVVSDTEQSTSNSDPFNPEIISPPSSIVSDSPHRKAGKDPDSLLAQVSPPHFPGGTLNADMGSESTEVTPFGSPLSSSVCSSMVSSIYQNSLQPVTSNSSVYVTASDISSIIAANGGSDRRKGSGELSIYDQTQTRCESPRKVSLASEVEVLAAEETGVNPGIMNDQENADGSEVFHDYLTFGDSGNKGDDIYDFDRLDHRLALYLMMSVFDNNEKFCFKNKTTVSQYMVEEEWEGLVVVTNMKMYILKINSEDSGIEPKDALTCTEIQPLAELQRVDVGLGRQTVRLEFSTDCSSYTLVTRNADKVEVFIQRMSDHLQTYAMENGLQMTTVFNEDANQLTLDNLSADVLKSSSHTDALRLYVLGYIARGHNPHSPMAFVVSTSEVCLVRTNHQWPSPLNQAPVTIESVGRQFIVLERQKINNIATITRHTEDKHSLRIAFFNETSGEETQWLVAMETEKNIVALIEAIRGPWEEAFDIDLDVEFDTFERTLCI